MEARLPLERDIWIPPSRSLPPFSGHYGQLADQTASVYGLGLSLIQEDLASRRGETRSVCSYLRTIQASLLSMPCSFPASLIISSHISSFNKALMTDVALYPH